MATHRTQELRSMAMHELVAERLLVDPTILVRAQERLEQWVAAGKIHEYWANGWREVLALPLVELAALLPADTERMIGLRQSSPFMVLGVVSEAERLRILHDVHD